MTVGKVGLPKVALPKVGEVIHEGMYFEHLRFSTCTSEEVSLLLQDGWQLFIQISHILALTP